MGPVFRGEDGETRDPVVIKVIRVGLAPERVTIVASALAALKDRLPAHPALVPLIDTGVVDVEPYIVSPFIDGDSLDVALREYGPAHMTDALPRLRALADAMDAAAAVGVAHGSLHLRDIVVSVGETVLTGIGIASTLERVGVRPPVRRPYCAPEVALGHGISPASDQYALAAIAHEWLSGRRLSGTGAAGFQVPVVTEGGVEALQAVFARAMDESPDSRFPTATAFVEAIAELAGHAAPRSRSSRRVPPVDAPRLAFDEPAEPPVARVTIPVVPPVVPDAPAVAASPRPPAAPPDAFDEPAMSFGIADDDVVPPDDDLLPDSSAEVAPDFDPLDPLDAPLHADPPASALDWDAVPHPEDAPAAFTAVDDDAAPDDLPVTPAEQRTPPVRRPAPFAPEPPAADDSDDGRSWTSWAVLLVVLTLSTLAGGWALLRWGTPSADPVATVTPAPSEPADAPAANAPPASSATSPARPAAPTPEPATPAAPAPSDARAPQAAPPVTPAPAETPAPAAPARRATPPPAKAAPARPAARPPVARATPPPPARKTRPAPAAATTGRVLVRSTPGGAEVFVNGERRGVTPLALRDLPFGTYTVRVVRAGFATIEQRVAIDARRPARALELTLVRASAASAAAPAAPADATAPGSLLVESRPAGARVTVDGAAVGVTPVTVPSLAPGSHTVRIERPGYAPITTTARVEARTRARVAVTLTAERPR